MPAAAAAAEPDQAGGCRGGYPGWRMVWGLAVTETVSYGVLYYSFAAFLLPMQHSLGFSQATLTGAFSLSVLLTGAGAVPAGAWLDCCGARGLMTAGSLLGAGCVLVWARAGNVLGLYLAFAGIGLAGAAVLYEPAFATINAWFDARRQQALLTVTMVAGLASTIFLPASAFLISRLGWRQALLILAAVQAATAVPHVLLVRRRPADHGWRLDGTRGPSSLPAAQAAGSAPAKAPPDVIRGGELSATLRSGPVAFLTAGAILGSGAIVAVAVLFLAYLRQGGYTLAVASAAAGALGLVYDAGPGPGEQHGVVGKALAGADLAAVRVRSGALDGAVVALEPVLILSPAQRVSTLTARLARVRNELAAPVFRGSPQARDLGDQIEEFGREAVTAGLHSLSGLS